MRGVAWMAKERRCGKVIVGKGDDEGLHQVGRKALRRVNSRSCRMLARARIAASMPISCRFSLGRVFAYESVSRVNSGPSRGLDQSIGPCKISKEVSMGIFTVSNRLPLRGELSGRTVMVRDDSNGADGPISRSPRLFSSKRIARTRCMWCSTRLATSGRPARARCVVATSISSEALPDRLRSSCVQT